MENRHKAAASSNGFLSLPLDAHDYESDDDIDYCILDQDNFKKVPYADVEAG